MLNSGTTSLDAWLLAIYISINISNTATRDLLITLLILNYLTTTWSAYCKCIDQQVIKWIISPYTIPTRIDKKFHKLSIQTTKGDHYLNSKF